MNSTIKTAVSIAAGLLMLGAVACQSAPASPSPADTPTESITQTTPAEPTLPAQVPQPPELPQGIVSETLPVVPPLAQDIISENLPAAPSLPPVNIGNNLDADESVETASVSGSVAYRERIALSSGAVIEIKLIDVSRADAPAITLGEQIIEDPGQVPVAFEIEYDPDDIDDRFSYAVSARITDQGRLMFINTSQYAVLTRGNPDTVDIMLQMVANPEPMPVPPPTEPQDLPDMVETPAPIESVKVVQSEVNSDEYILHVTSGLPSGCAEFNDAEMTRDGNDINVTVTNLMPAPGVLIACTMIYGYHDSEINLGNDFEAGATYNVTVNDETITFLAGVVEVDEPAIDEPQDAAEKVEVPAPIEKANVVRSENNQYVLNIVSGLPGGCAEFSDADMTRNGNEINVTVTNLVPGPDVLVTCTMIYGYHESTVNLGSDFEAGESYTVTVNGEHNETFIAG
jgi:uncharacterized lipoprotein YbaY